MSGDDRVRRALRARRARFVSGLRLFREHVRALCHLRPESRRRGCPSPRPRAAILVTYGDLTVAHRVGYATELNGHGDDMPDHRLTEETHDHDQPAPPRERRS